jgi:Mg-chelatase subunit ChlD
MRLITRAQAWCAPLVAAATLISLVGAGFVIDAPSEVRAQEEPGTQVNVELMMDSSGSMAAETDTGEPRIDAAKRVLNQVIDAIPDDRPGINVGFRVFGHLGDNTEAGRAESCQSSELTVPVEGVDKDALRQQVADYAPVGWTPIGLSLERAAADFPAASDTVTNAIILVTDGLETCDADPCAIATALKESEAAITVYVVGLGLDEEELRITSCIAENTGGQIVGAQNADQLSAALFTFLEELEVVVTTGFLEIESIGGLYPLATLTCAEQGATDLNPEGGEPFTYTFTPDTNRVEVPIGVCDLTWANPSGSETAIRVNIEADRTTFVRGSLLKFPQGAGEIYVLKAQDGTVIWQDQIEQGDWVWVLPGIYTCDLAELVGDPILMSFTVQTLPGSATQVEIFTAP